MLQLLKNSIIASGLAVLGLVAPPAFASDLCATVVDLAHLPLPSASVNAIHLATGKSYAGQTANDGRTCVSGLPEGLYSVEAHLPGFLHVRYYPVRVTPLAKQYLSFSLPFAEIREGGVVDESTLAGTLSSDGIAVDSATVCMTSASTSLKTCTTTNDLGEYVLLGPADNYDVEIRTRGGAVCKSRVDMSVAGIYRNRLSMDPSSGAKGR
jgi:hypothetical protein